MLQLDFNFSDKWNETIDFSQIAELSEIDLRYGTGLGNLTFVVNGVDCSAPWGWIPMVDLAVALHDIREELAGKTSGVEVFEFTESNATITIERIGVEVRLTTNYAPCSEIISFNELDGVISEFRDKVFREAVSHFPALDRNVAFRLLRERTVMA